MWTISIVLGNNKKYFGHLRAHVLSIFVSIKNIHPLLVYLQLLNIAVSAQNISNLVSKTCEHITEYLYNH